MYKAAGEPELSQRHLGQQERPLLLAQCFKAATEVQEALERVLGAIMLQLVALEEDLEEAWQELAQ